MKASLILLTLLTFGCAQQSKPEPDYKNLPEYDCGILPEVVHDSTKENILVVGDSISIGYTPKLRTELSGYNVFHNECNAGYSGHGVLKIDQYLSVQPRFKAIIFNFGIWDLWTKEISAESYAINLRKIVEKMKLSSDRIVFVTTTKSPHDATRKGIFKQYAVDLMIEMNVEVFDLGAYSEGLGHLQDADQVHFNSQGADLLGSAIADYMF